MKKIIAYLPIFIKKRRPSANDKMPILQKCVAFAASVAFSAALTVTAAADWQPTVSAASAVLINADTGTVLYEKDAYSERAIASTTKIMTALLTFEAGSLDVPFTVDSAAIMVEGTSMGLKKGDIVTRRALCTGMLLPSGNDAANAAAVSVAGGMADFAELMNRRAEEIGMKNTHFVNPSGLDADGHYSTAYDMALLTAEAMKNPEFAAVCGLTSACLEYGNPPYTRWLKNNNKLLVQYSGCIGVKTGFTDNAKRCLVSAAERDGATLICVTLRDPDDWRDHASMLDYGFTLVKKRAVKVDLSAFSVNVVGGKSKTAALSADEILLPCNEDELKRLTVTADIVPFVYGGESAGTRAGTLRLSLGDKLVLSAPLYTAERAEPDMKKLGFIDEIIRFFGKLF